MHMLLDSPRGRRGRRLMPLFLVLMLMHKPQRPQAVQQLLYAEACSQLRLPIYIILCRLAPLNIVLFCLNLQSQTGILKTVASCADLLRLLKYQIISTQNMLA